MSNYTSGNLINVSASEVPAGTLAMKVGNDVFIAGGVNITSTYNVTSTYNITSNFIEQIGDAYVVVDDNGTLKAQKLAFDSTTASDSGEPETLENVMIFNTGHDEPEYEGGNSTDYYKCASVNVQNQTWTGYRAVQDPVTHVYSFIPTVTTGLTYSVVTPEVGKVYADGALIEANLFTIPTDSLVLYAPLSAASATAETGQTIGTIGSVNYGTVSGIPCADSDTTKTLYVDEIMSVLDPSIPKTLSCWVYITSWNGNNDGLAIFCCMQAGGGIAIHLTSSACACKRRAGSSYDTVSFGQLALNTWYHLAVTDDGIQMRTYRNGTLITETQPTWSYSEAQDSINAGITGPGDSVSDFVYNLIGHMAAYRIYNRALTATEIAALANEFTPAQE